MNEPTIEIVQDDACKILIQKLKPDGNEHDSDSIPNYDSDNMITRSDEMKDEGLGA